MESLFSKDTLTYKKKIVFNAGVESIIDYVNQKKNFVTDIQLLFSPFGLPFVPIEILGTNTNKIITNLTWTKDRNNPGGMLSCEIAPDTYEIKKIVDIINKFTGNLYSKIWGELGVDLEDLFKPMTLCQLWINGYHVMTGTVRSCIRNASVTNTDKTATYSVVLDELGNIYNQSTLSMDLIEQDGLQFQIADSLTMALELVSTIKGTNLSVGLASIVQAFRITALSAGVSLSDGFPLFLRLLAMSNPIGAIANLPMASFINVDSSLFQTHSSGGGQSSVWSFMKNYVPNPWMEFYTESGGRTIVTDTIGVPAVLFPGFNYIVARTVPYSNPLLGTVSPAHFAQTLAFELNALSMIIGGDFIIITDDIISNYSLGFDSSNQNTVFHTLYACGGVTQAADLTDRSIKCVGPLNPFASGGISTFGIREMFQSIDSTSLEGLGAFASYASRIGKNILGLPFEIVSKNALSNLLAVWFRNQSRFREGTVTIRGMPHARAGMYCLYLPSLSGKKPENLRNIGMYYIDSLSHNYSITNNDIEFTTTLNLIRGVPLPMTVAQTALLLFDFEIIPPDPGILDGAYRTLQAIREGISVI